MTASTEQSAQGTSSSGTAGSARAAAAETPPDDTPDSAQQKPTQRGRPSTRTEADGEDEKWMRAYKEGDVSGFQNLVKRHEAPLYRFCLRSLGDKEQAADATQEVFMRIVKNATRWERKAKFTTWMYTIARNYCIDEARKARFRKKESLNESIGRDDDGGSERIERVVDEMPDSSRVTDSKRMRTVIDDTLAALPEEQRQVFCLREYGGLAFKDIASSVEVGENTVKSRMRYALSSLREALLAAGFHPPNTS
ncbi:MAG: RNA polymerase sigma factor [Deltaproteobacteria bacterium]|nr:RNA polymerase sigma factor [Deltaproteobacteria bacterium]